jgi:putative ABC transport system ATP-binding protein
MKDETMLVIRARGLRKSHRLGGGTVHALAGVDIDIPEGDFLAICGPSGSGKSTLLSTLGLLDPPDEGQISVDGHPVRLERSSDLSRIRAERFGFVFQQFNLIPVLSALENVELPLYLTAMKPRERRELASDLLHAVGLGDRIHNRPAQLSGGQQQRVAVARALARSPGIVLADEPTANLDTGTASQLIDLMLGLNQERGTAFVIATHDPGVVARASRVVRLADGVMAS